MVNEGATPLERSGTATKGDLRETHVSRDDPAVGIRKPGRPMGVHGPGRPTEATLEPTSGEGSDGRFGLWIRSSLDEERREE